MRDAATWADTSILPRSELVGTSISLRLQVSQNRTTRAHVRLLGPCFKTGRISTLNCHRRPVLHDPSEDAARQQLYGPRAGPRSVIPNARTSLRPARTPNIWGRSNTCVSYRLPIGQVTRGPRRMSENTVSGSHRDRRPSPNGSRRPTGGEVRPTAVGISPARPSDHRNDPATACAERANDAI